jgi:Sulfatase
LQPAIESLQSAKPTPASKAKTRGKMWARRIFRALVGDHPVAILCFAAPTFLAIAMDVALRARSLLAFPAFQWLNYFGSSLASAGFWGGPLWLVSRLFTKDSRGAKLGISVFALVFVFPLAFLCFGGQALYFLVFRSYMARDTVRLGIALRGTLAAWLASWGASAIGMAVIGLIATFAILSIARRAAPLMPPALPIVPIVAFVGSFYCFWIDFVESRSLQAAPPDTCFIHGVVHALHDGLTGKGWARHGISLREPVPLPPIATPAHRPNVVFIVSESMRSDVWCSAHEGGCRAQFLDPVAPDRLGLGRLTMQSSGTFTSCVMLWTGLSPDADFSTLHHAPVLWEIAHGAGYRTAYIGAQNLRYDDFGSFLRRASIDVLVGAADLGDAADPHIGAPDENATARFLAFAREVPVGTPYYAVLHLSNTHWPYRVDPGLQPNAPHDESPTSPMLSLFNHYKNSVLLQERTVSAMIRELRSLPSWHDTVVIFVSDHGEEFREHGHLYHLSTVFDDQVRVPSWLLAGDDAITLAQRHAIGAYAGRRTYTQDIYMTIVDALGVYDQRPSFPFAGQALGRSLLRPPPRDEPTVVLSNASGVWEPDIPRFGVMHGENLAESGTEGDWRCFDTHADPTEHETVDITACADSIKIGAARFGLRVPLQIGVTK